MGGRVNPTILVWARQRLGLTPDQVAQAAEKLKKRYFEPFTQEELILWEQGSKEPSLAQLETLAEIYVCPVGYFFLQTPPEEKLPLQLRGLRVEKESELSPEARAALRRFYQLAKWTVWLMEMTGERVFPRIQPAPTAPEDLARSWRMRLKWNPTTRESLGYDPEKAFFYLRREIEELGIFCFALPLPSAEVRGAALWLEGFPFILINSNDAQSYTGRLFTLLHEFGHILTQQEGIVCDFIGQNEGREAERIANRFAAEFLLPSEDFASYLREKGYYQFRENWSDARIDELRKEFVVSRDVVVIHLEKVGLAPKGSYERLRERWNRKKGFGRSKRKGIKSSPPILRRYGYTFLRLLQRSLNHGNFPWSDAADWLRISPLKMHNFLNNLSFAS